MNAKERRKAERAKSLKSDAAEIAEQTLKSVTGVDENHDEWGLGELSHRESNGLTPPENKKIDSMALKYGWPEGEFPLQASESELKAIIANGGKCAPVAVVLSAMEGLEREDNPVRQSSAEKNIIEMMKSNAARNAKGPTIINGDVDNRRVVILPQNGRESKALEQH
jgi:hypothetical protein